MGLRAIFAGPNSEGSEVITGVISHLGHDIRIVPGPDYCHAFTTRESHCPLDKPCCDVKILANGLPGEMSGLEFLAWQKRCGCKVRDEFCAVLAAEPSAYERQTATRLGAMLMSEPYRIKDLVDWLYRAQKGSRSFAKSS